MTNKRNSFIRIEAKGLDGLSVPGSAAILYKFDGLQRENCCKNNPYCLDVQPLWLSGGKGPCKRSFKPLHSILKKIITGCLNQIVYGIV